MEQPKTLNAGSLDALVSRRWMCRLCGRDKFTKPGQPHKCTGGYRKRFKNAARLNGWDNCWVKLANACVSDGPADAHKSPSSAEGPFAARNG